MPRFGVSGTWLKEFKATKLRTSLLWTFSKRNISVSVPEGLNYQFLAFIGQTLVLSTAYTGIYTAASE